MSGTREVIVVNLTNFSVSRGRYCFPPRGEKTVFVTPAGYAEIKACQFLKVFDAGLKCNYPGCNFIAKNERSLKFHKKQKHSPRKKGDNDNE